VCVYFLMHARAGWVATLKERTAAAAADATKRATAAAAASAAAASAAYGSRDLAGLKVAHGAEAFEGGVRARACSCVYTGLCVFVSVSVCIRAFICAYICAFVSALASGFAQKCSGVFLRRVFAW
jgi:hypothetical protein